MKFLITGGTGLIGKNIVQLLIKNNHQINILSRKKKDNSKHVSYFKWNPKRQTIEYDSINDVDVVINLAGENIFGLWTSSKKNKILKSRVQSLQLLKKLIKHKPNKVKQMISASAIGIFPNSDEIIYNENSDLKGKTFLANIVEQWEKEIESFEEFNIAVTTVRIGMVFSELGGIIKVLRMILKSRVLFLIGNGNQKISWIHINDLSQLFYKLSLINYNGLIHAVNNNPTTMLDLLEKLSDKYKFCFKIFTPNIILKSLFKFLYLNDFYADIANSSKNVISLESEKINYKFKYNDINDL